MTCGTPVIISNVSSLPEIVGEGGIKIDPYDLDEAYDKILEILKNEKLKTEMREKAIERSKLFSWEKCIKETLKIYENIYN